MGVTPSQAAAFLSVDPVTGEMRLVLCPEWLQGVGVAKCDSPILVYYTILQITYYSLIELLHRTVGVLDREQLGSRIEVAVQAADQGTIPLSNSSRVVITLTDINDNYPLFPNLSYVSHVREDVRVGSVVTEVTATDADIGFAGDVRYVCCCCCCCCCLCLVP